MSKTTLTVFLCTGKDCSKAWRHICDSSPGKWLKRRLEEAGLPYRVDVIKTECMDRCKHAANICFVHDRCAEMECDVRRKDDTDRILAAMRACVERADSCTHDSLSIFSTDKQP